MIYAIFMFLGVMYGTFRLTKRFLMKHTQDIEQYNIFCRYPVEDIEDCTEDMEEIDDESADAFPYSLNQTEKERKKAFDRQQALLDVEYYIGQVDSLYSEYHTINEDLQNLSMEIAVSQAMREVDKTKRHYKDRAKLEKKLRSLDASIHTAEKRLRSAQFKAGIEITC